VSSSLDDSPSDVERLRQLVVHVLERLDLEGPSALEQVCSEHPDLASRLRRRVGSLAGLGLVEDGSGGRMPEHVGEFELKEKIGAGGMGVVYRALQTSLGREVAIKLIRPDALHLPESRERFARETAIVAKLAHPGIVPIHVVGSDEKLPYYAMEFVPGCTLAEAMMELAGREPQELAGADLWRAVCARSRKVAQAAGGPALVDAGPLFAGSWEQTCSRLVSQVCEALGHAHGRGVLHRDLKPSNIMITPRGRVMLFDFGLSQSEGSDTMTGLGDRIGSLPYMPPELLRDGPRALDRRSDVYGLGVTLYQLLTLRLPFQAASPPAVMARILEGRPPRPRAWNPALSWEAETVCLAAMELDLERRYATTDAFARDLSNVLRRLPVEARRASLALRARRWVERRPGEATAAGLLLLLPVVAAFLLAREARHVGAALDVAEEQARRADDNRARVLRSIEAMLVKVGRESLAGVPGMRTLRVELLAEASRLYEELLAERPDDLEAVLLAGRCDYLQSRFLGSESRAAEAEEVGRRALERLEPFGTQPGAERMRALLTSVVAEALRGLEHLEPAAELQGEAIARMRACLEQDDADEELHLALLREVSDEAWNDRRLGTTRSGTDRLQENVSILRELNDRRQHPPTMRALALALNHLGAWLQREAMHAEAAETFLEELELRRELFALEPSDEQDRHKLAASASNLAGGLIREKQPAQALELLAFAEEETARLRHDFPGVPDYEYAVVDVQINRGAALAAIGKHAEACDVLLAAVDGLHGLRARYPREVEYARALGTVLVNLGSRQVDLGDPELGLEYCEAAQVALEEAVASRPGSVDVKAWLAIESEIRARVLLALDRPGEAADRLIRTLQLAGPRTEVVRSALGRIVLCLDAARASADEEARELCELAAREILALAEERGDLQGDAKLSTLRQRLVAE
jgi:serine/threonine protein kinase